MTACGEDGVVAGLNSWAYHLVSGSEEHLRSVLKCFDLKRLTTQVRTTLLEILERNFPYVDDFLSGIHK